jgi:hypothetical protein
MEKSGQISVMERTFLNAANETKTGETVKYSFNLNN